MTVKVPRKGGQDSFPPHAQHPVRHTATPPIILVGLTKARKHLLANFSFGLVNWFLLPYCRLQHRMSNLSGWREKGGERSVINPAQLSMEGGGWANRAVDATAMGGP